MTEVRVFDRASDFADACGAFLGGDEVRHNLIYSLALQLRDDGVWTERPPYLAAMLHDGRVAGCALRTPPFKLIVSPAPEHALRALAADAAQRQPDLTAVVGEDAAARAFVAAWMELRGGRAREGMRQRIYRLDRLVPPARPTAGAARTAMREDTPLVLSWIREFSEELGMHAQMRGPAERRIARGDFLLWEDGEPVAMAGVAGRTPHSVRIGYVYTPRPLRGRGYAAAVTAAITARELDGGARAACLFTDLSNPTSNGIYRRLGYVPVTDWVDLHLSDS